MPPESLWQSCWRFKTRAQSWKKTSSWVSSFLSPQSLFLFYHGQLDWVTIHLGCYCSRNFPVEEDLPQRCHGGAKLWHSLPMLLDLLGCEQAATCCRWQGWVLLPCLPAMVYGWTQSQSTHLCPYTTDGRESVPGKKKWQASRLCSQVSLLVYQAQKCLTVFYDLPGLPASASRQRRNQSRSNWENSVKINTKRVPLPKSLKTISLTKFGVKLKI